MIYYTKDGLPSFYPQTEEDRFGLWVKRVSDWRPYNGKNRGTGIAEPTVEEITAIRSRRCRYRRAARASRA